MTFESKANRLREAVDTYRKLDDSLCSYEHGEFEMWVDELIEMAEEKESGESEEQA